MEIKVLPSSCFGSVNIPPSKSMAHRAIMCASLASGTSIIKNVAYSKDILATIDAMNTLGATIIQKEDYLQIHGITDFQHLQNNEVFCNESGSTLRFLIPLFSLCNQPITFTGAGRLLQRPQHIYKQIFDQQDCYFQQDAQGIHIKQALKPATFTLPGNVSSQFISGLLFTLPLLKEDSTIVIEPPFESKSYVDLTLQMLQHYGVYAYYTDEYTLHIPGNQTYNAADYTIEADYSQFAFFAILAACGFDLQISGMNPNSKQGDKQIIDILNNFHAQIKEQNGTYTIRKSELQACDINLENCPDLGPILCVLAMFSKGTTHIYNAKRLRIKESDRILAMEQELRKFNVNITSSEDEIWIEGNHFTTCTQPLYGHNDHRIVMALTIASLCTHSTCILQDVQAISKSYPNFFEHIEQIHGKVEYL